MAKAFPNSQFVGYDFHPSSIENAAAHAQEHGVTANTRFEVATVKGYPERDFDLVAFFDCLHDMGDPAGVAAHVRQSLKPDGHAECSANLLRQRGRHTPHRRARVVNAA